MAEINIRFSDLSSISFNDDWIGCEQQQVTWAHKFLSSDLLRVQLAINADAFAVPNVLIVNRCDGERVGELDLVKIYEDASTAVYEFSITGLAEGDYEVQLVSPSGRIASSWFDVREEQPCTVLLTYNNHKSDFGTIFTPDTPFHTRIDGEFLPQDDSFGIEGDNFRDQNHTLRNLSAYPSTVRKLSFGGPDGAPNFIGNKVNRIFACSEVYVDGVRYVAADDASAAGEVWAESYPKYPFKISLEKQEQGFFSASISESPTPRSLRLTGQNMLLTVDRNNRLI